MNDQILITKKQTERGWSVAVDDKYTRTRHELNGIPTEEEADEAVAGIMELIHRICEIPEQA
jgi:hypothetical protein